MSHIGGKLMLFSAAACTVAAAPTKNRDAPAHYNSEREPALRNPSDPFFNAFASECIAAQISVDIYAASSAYLDLFSLATLPRSTGAHLGLPSAFYLSIYLSFCQSDGTVELRNAGISDCSSAARFKQSVHSVCDTVNVICKQGVLVYIAGCFRACRFEM